MPIRRQTAEADLRVVEAHKQSAHTDCTPACRVDMIDYDVDKGHILVSTRAVSARVNLNYDGFTSAELKKSYRSFVGKPIYVNHVNYDPMRTRGVIVGANYHEHGDDKFVECLMDVDGNAFPKLAEEIVEGNIDSVSMGASVQSTTCSVCGKNMVEVDDFCDHVAHHKGQMIYSANEGHDVLCYETLVSPSFFELSFVFDPADTTALTQNVKAASVKASYEDDPAVPPKVDTEGEEPCPDCGNDLWDGEVCEVCGYVAPPEGLDDPDLQKNKDVEVREPEDDPAEDVESDKDDKKEAAVTNTRKTDVRVSRLKKASIPNAIYHNADGTDELVVLDSGDNVVEVIRTLDTDESNEILTGASDEFERVPGWDSSFPIGDGDIVKRIQPVGFDDTVMYAKNNRKAKMNNKNRRTDIRASRTKKASLSWTADPDFEGGLVATIDDVSAYVYPSTSFVPGDPQFGWTVILGEGYVPSEGWADSEEEAKDIVESFLSDRGIRVSLKVGRIARKNDVRMSRNKTATQYADSRKAKRKASRKRVAEDIFKKEVGRNGDFLATISYFEGGQGWTANVWSVATDDMVASNNSNVYLNDEQDATQEALRLLDEIANRRLPKSPGPNETEISESEVSQYQDSGYQVYVYYESGPYAGQTNSVGRSLPDSDWVGYYFVSDLTTVPIFQAKNVYHKKAAFSGQYEDDAVQAALETILWACTDENGDPLENRYNTYDFDNASFQQISNMVKNFAVAADEAYEDINKDLTAEYSAENLGHTFILDVLNTGSGFFDDGNVVLENIADGFPELDVYVGDDGKIYL